nr:hypothetical protein [Dyella soli]
MRSSKFTEGHIAALLRWVEGIGPDKDLQQVQRPDAEPNQLK